MVNVKVEVKCIYCQHFFKVFQDNLKLPKHTLNGKLLKQASSYTPCFGSDTIGVKVNVRKDNEKIEYFVDKEPSSLLGVVEKTPKRGIWKKYLEKNKLQNSESAKRYLTKRLGDFISASEIHKLTGIRTKSLDKWRNQGIVKAKILKNRWYYSFKSVVSAIKTANVNDLR
jgi:hypothetical protein